MSWCECLSLSAAPPPLLPTPLSLFLVLTFSHPGVTIAHSNEFLSLLTKVHITCVSHVTYDVTYRKINTTYHEMNKRYDEMHKTYYIIHVTRHCAAYHIVTHI